MIVKKIQEKLFGNLLLIGKKLARYAQRIIQKGNVRFNFYRSKLLNNVDT